MSLKMCSDRVCGWTNWIAVSSQLLQMALFSVDETLRVENFIVKLEGKSGKIISIGCWFPPKFTNSGTLYTSIHYPRPSIANIAAGEQRQWSS